MIRQVYDFLKKARTYYLATVDEGQPRVRPFGSLDIFEGKLYIHTGKVKPVYKQLKENPRVEICAMDGSEWIRIEGEAVEDDRVEAKQHMLDEHPSLKDRYSADDANTALFYIKNATATITSRSGKPVVIKF